MENFLENECYCQMVRITSLLTYFDFELKPLEQIKFQNCKLLYRLGTDSDWFNIYFKLYDIESALRGRIIKGER